MKKNDFYLSISYVVKFGMLSCVIVKYVETKFVWNEFKTNTNLDCNKSDLNTRHTLNCDSLKIFYRVNSRWIVSAREEEGGSS
jgi:hypothetical protein